MSIIFWLLSKEGVGVPLLPFSCGVVMMGLKVEVGWHVILSGAKNLCA